MRPVGSLAAFLPIVFLAVGCTQPAADATRGDVELTVFAAASLSGGLAEAARIYEAAHPGSRLVVSTHSSAALATQIEQGAPADLFLSADRATVDRLVTAGLTTGDPVVFAANQLALIVPSGNPAGLETAADLGRAGVTVIAAAGDVPISRYADQLIRNLVMEPGYPADFAARYQGNVASHEDNVTAVVAKVELGEGDAGIVYRTDAAASNRVEVVPIPEDANVRVDHVGAVISSSSNAAEAAVFLDWLAGRDGQAVLGRFGFGAPPP